MINALQVAREVLWRFTPFWLFLIFFKFGAGLHYSLLAPLGDRVLPLWAVGAIMGGASLAQLLLDVPAGKLLDRFGYKRLMVVGTTFFLVAALCISFTFSVTTYLLSIAFSIVGWLFFGPGVNAYILSSASVERSGLFMSLRDISGSLGIVLSSALLAFVLVLHPTQMGWVIFGLIAISLLALVLAAPEARKIPEPHKRTRKPHPIREFKSILRTLRRLNPASSIILTLHLASGIFYGMIWFVVPLVIAHQANSELLSIGLGIFDFSVVALGFALGILADRVNKRTLVFFGLLMFAIFGMLLGFNFGILFILFGFLATAGEEMAGLSLWSWLHALDTEHANDGSVSGVISLFEDFGWMIGPLAAGILYGMIGPSLTIVVGALPIALVWLVYTVRARHHDPHHATVPRTHRISRKRHKS